MEDNTMTTRNGPYKRWRLDGKPTDPPAYTAEWHPPLHRYAVMVIVTAPDEYEAGRHVDEATGGVVTAVYGEDANPVIVDRARFERLLMGVDVLLRRVESAEGLPGRETITAALFDPGDLDPLP